VNVACYHSLNQLMHLIGKEVCINRGEPGFLIGRLVSIQNDYVVIQTKARRVIYYRSYYIVSLSESRRKMVPTNYEQGVEVIMAHTFHELLSSLLNHPMILDAGGPQVERGLLSRITADEVVMEVKEKSVGIPLGQIRYAASE
jgi:hypothetical protein